MKVDCCQLPLVGKPATYGGLEIVVFTSFFFYQESAAPTATLEKIGCCFVKK